MQFNVSVHDRPDRQQELYPVSLYSLRSAVSAYCQRDIEYRYTWSMNNSADTASEWDSRQQLLSGDQIFRFNWLMWLSSKFLKFGSLEIWKFWSLEVLKFWRFEFLNFKSFEVVKFWIAEVWNVFQVILSQFEVCSYVTLMGPKKVADKNEKGFSLWHIASRLDSFQRDTTA